MTDAESSTKAEVESKGDEKGGLVASVLEQWQVLVKIVELILCSICVGIVFEPLSSMGFGKSRLHHVGVMFTAYTGYILINTVLLVGHALKDKIPYKTSTIFSMSGAILNLVAVCLLANDRANYSKFMTAAPPRSEAMLVSIVVAAINALVFAMESVFTFIRKEDF